MNQQKETKIIWHGHANFQIEQVGINIIIDPFFSDNPSTITTWDEISPPDIVLVTHLHDDHIGDAVAICKKFNAKLGVVVGVAEKMLQAGVSKELILNGVGFNIGGTVSHKGVNITMTEAFHTSQAGVPVGYILTLPNGFIIYHAGDTGIFRNMKTWGELYSIDLALLPAGGIFTMDMRQAAQAARFLKAKRIIPMHWGTFSALAGDMSSLKADLAQNPGPQGHCECCMLKPGESIILQ